MEINLSYLNFVWDRLFSILQESETFSSNISAEQ